ncbi:MAG: hypothetical protein Q7T87_22110 [Polaromonas sp.]|nr:hypothetical protein [Polaromonas sp.]
MKVFFPVKPMNSGEIILHDAKIKDMNASGIGDKSSFRLVKIAGSDFSKLVYEPPELNAIPRFAKSRSTEEDYARLKNLQMAQLTALHRDNLVAGLFNNDEAMIEASIDALVESGVDLATINWKMGTNTTAQVKDASWGYRNDKTDQTKDHQLREEAYDTHQHIATEVFINVQARLANSGIGNTQYVLQALATGLKKSIAENSRPVLPKPQAQPQPQPQPQPPQRRRPSPRPPRRARRALRSIRRPLRDRSSSMCQCLHPVLRLRILSFRSCNARWTPAGRRSMPTC